MLLGFFRGIKRQIVSSIYFILKQLAAVNPIFDRSGFNVLSNVPIIYMAFYRLKSNLESIGYVSI